jgi:hypothetical protein
LFVYVPSMFGWPQEVRRMPLASTVAVGVVGVDGEHAASTVPTSRAAPAR